MVSVTDDHRGVMPGFHRHASSVPSPGCGPRSRAWPGAWCRLRSVLELASGFMATHAIYPAAKLGIGDTLAAGPLSSSDIAARIGSNPDATHRLLRACARRRDGLQHVHVGTPRRRTCFRHHVQQRHDSPVGPRLADTAPSDGDLYVMRRVIHDFDDDRAAAILANLRRHMPDASTPPPAGECGSAGPPHTSRRLSTST